MANASGKFNVRNPAVKRIMQEIKELQSETCPDFIADALEEDIFEWHFVIRGPPDTEFEGGIFHGRILLPAEYPFKPPAFMMLTPNGRFQTGTKICLSISSHHPEHWQPSWSVRTALTALIAFMPTPGQGAIGSLDFTKEERMQLAAKSRTDIPKFGSAARQKVINDMHTRFMELQQSLAAAAASSSGSNGSSPAKAPPAAAAVRDVQSPSRASVDQGVAGAAAAEVVSPDSSKQQEQQQEQQPVFSLQQQQQRVSQVSLGGSSDQLPPLLRSTNSGSSGGSNSPPAATAAPVRQQQQQVVAAMQQQQQVMAAAALGPGSVSDMPGDRGLTFLIVVLSVAIVAMLLKKVVVAFGDVRHPTL